MNRKSTTFAFVLGSNPALSVAEILAILDCESDGSSILVSKEILLVSGTVVTPEMIETLGGTIKIIEILSTIPKTEYDPDQVIKFATDFIESSPSEATKKFHLGISIYNLDGSKTMLARLGNAVRFLYINIKKLSKERGRKVAFLSSKERSLSSASVIKNGLLHSDGAEISLISCDDTVLIGKTIAVQDIDKYSQMDVGRPERDLVSGTTPPKLAKIMINLAQRDKEAVILDPFCGSGTFLQEMQLLGFKNISGSDISEEAINISKENLAWLANQKDVKMAKPEIKVVDALKLGDVYGSESVDSIVSEVYLGPPLRDYLSASDLEALIGDLSHLYQRVLAQMSKVIRKNGTIVLALPIFKTRQGSKILNIDEGIKQAGLRIENPLEGLNSDFGQYLTKRLSIVYSRPDQFVQREIIILHKNI